MKKYISVSGTKNVFVVNGKLITFFGHTTPYYITNCPKEQKAIERSRAFAMGKIKVEDVEEEAQEEKEELAPIGDIANTNDAIAYLVEHYGVKKTTLRSKAAIVACAEEKGIVFVDLK